jgi:tight adherence protein C
MSMSSLLLVFAALGAFGSIYLGVMAVEAYVTERRRALAVLQGQVTPVTTDLREKELARPFMERAFVPFVAGVGGFVRRVTPLGWRERVARKIVLAGSPEGMDADKVVAIKIFGTVGGMVVGVALAALAGLSLHLAATAGLVAAVFGFLIPGGNLSQRVLNRQDTIRRALPDTIDLLTISVEAGLSFDAALVQVRDHIPGPLSQEISRMLQEMQIGVSRTDSLRHLGDRTDVSELNGFILAMIQAEQFGVSIANVLRAQATEMRTKRRQMAEEKAQKIAIKLLFPLIFCILPAMFIVILGPGIIRFVQSFLGVKL